VRGLQQVRVQTLAEVKELMNIGLEERSEGSTSMNSNSSRSHWYGKYQLMQAFL